MTIYKHADKAAINNIVAIALAEDHGAGDLTTSLIANGGELGQARLLAKGDFILAGIEVFAEVFHHLDNTIKTSLLKNDGEECHYGDLLAIIAGSLPDILAGERVALNLLQRMAGIATLTSAFVREVAGTRARILDTRKTAPGLRVLDKYAVRVGGGQNHRWGLYDMILIKENHIAIAGSVAEALRRAHEGAQPGMQMEIEVRNIVELDEAVAGGADIVMLDNMSIEQMREAVLVNQTTYRPRRVLLEASGNISLANVRAVAQTGVDFISVGTLTHSVIAADISLLVDV